MFERSITLRIHWTVISVSVIGLLIAITVVTIAHKAMESSILEIDLQETRDLVLAAAQEGKAVSWIVGGIQAYYVPEGARDPGTMPQIFANLPFPYLDDVDIGDSTYLVSTSYENGGKLYLAKDISPFEDRVRWIEYVTIGTSLGALVVTLVLAKLGSMRIVRPLLQLADHIGKTRPGSEMARVPVEHGDAELRAIAETFNYFLDELETYMKWEQSLLSLASHELRTPIFVISGALQIVSSRGKVDPDDAKTIERARQAAVEMASNVEVLLRLGRRKAVGEVRENVSLLDVAGEVVADLKRAGQESDRVIVEEIDTDLVRTERVLIKMVMRNLVENSLKHTKGSVRVRLVGGLFEVEDYGTGLSTNDQEILTNGIATEKAHQQLRGLGLLIVRMISDHLGWRVDVRKRGPNGMVISLSNLLSVAESQPRGALDNSPAQEKLSDRARDWIN